MNPYLENPDLWSEVHLDLATMYHIGLLIYPGMTQLDITGPAQFFAYLPEKQIYWIWKDKAPVTSHEGLTILPTTTFTDCPPLDVICVPGGPGQVQIMADQEVLEFLQQQSHNAKYITSVCTGSLILGAAGLLKGYRATSHWSVVDQLTYLGAEAVNERVVINNNRITGGGVTAGIDFGLTVVPQLCGDDIAKLMQLILQYDPQPPYTTGTPEQAGIELLNQAQAMAQDMINASWEQTHKAASALGTKI